MTASSIVQDLGDNVIKAEGTKSIALYTALVDILYLLELYAHIIAILRN